jgi:malate dehydrogenase (decarboxylating)
MAVLGKPTAALADQSFVVVGAGTAGMGVIRMLAAGMVKHGLSPEAAAARFHVIDAGGLITAGRPGLTPTVAPFARRDAASREGEGLVEVIRRTAPTCLIGLAGAGRLFTHEALALMGELQERPLIFALSNPTSKMECTHAEAQAACGGRAIFAAGGPQPDIQVGGRLCVASQANNM